MALLLQLLREQSKFYKLEWKNFLHNLSTHFVVVAQPQSFCFVESIIVDDNHRDMLQGFFFSPGQIWGVKREEANKLMHSE